MKRLSVIVPGYNTRKEWWVRCVTSIARALTSEDEIIVVDDGSREPVKIDWFQMKMKGEECRGPIIKLIRHGTNLGLPSGRNSGIEAAQGKYATFVDSDDEVREESYSRTITAMEANGADIGVYGVNGIHVADHYQVRDIPDNKYFGALTPRDVASLVKKRLFYYSCNKVFRRSFIDEHHLRFNPEGVPCEDAIFNVACVVNRAKWVTVDYLGYIYYRYDGSLLSSYKPTLVEGQRACTKAWHDYKAAIPGAVEQMDEYGLGWYDERSEREIAWNQWLNIWRRRSPYSPRARWRWLRENGCILFGGKVPSVIRLGWEFVKMGCCMFVRAHFYIGPLRRWHQKRFLMRIGAKIEKFGAGGNWKML